MHAHISFLRLTSFFLWSGVCFDPHVALFVCLMHQVFVSEEDECFGLHITISSSSVQLSNYYCSLLHLKKTEIGKNECEFVLFFVYSFLCVQDFICC